MRIYTAKVYSNRSSKFTMYECDAQLALNILKGKTHKGEATIYFGDEMVGRRWILSARELQDGARRGSKYGWFFDHGEISGGDLA